MATVHPNPQARDCLPCCSRCNDSRTIQIIPSMSHNPAHAQPLASIQPKEFTSTSNDQSNLYLDAFMGYQRDQPTDAMSSSHQVFPGKAYLDFPQFRLSLTEPQEEEVIKLTKAGRSTSVSAEQAQAIAHYTENVWMQFDAREGPNQPVILDVSYTLYPNSYPASDFSPVLLRFFRWETLQRRVIVTAR